jgi:hypothetical protein
MTIKLNTGRQEVITARVAWTFGTGADVAIQGAYPAIQVPFGTIILGGHVYVSGATSASVAIAVGDATVPTRYVSGINGAAAALTVLVPTGYTYPKQDNILVTISAADPAAAGTAELIIRYLVLKRVEFSQG